jgi:peptidyl-prolyl cis-trans isomerase A (cyclophilin A)
MARRSLRLGAARRPGVRCAASSFREVSMRLCVVRTPLRVVSFVVSCGIGALLLGPGLGRAETHAPKTQKGNPVVVLETSQGSIEIELDPKQAPITVENFLGYVDSGFYDGTIFHRVMPGFMIQGGGFDASMTQKATRDPIKNEAANGLENRRGTIAMARTSAVDSATAQFFINLKDNDFLNHGTRDYGYAVFGHVVQGMDVVDKIGGVQTTTKGMFENVPVAPVVIRKAYLKKE